METKDLLDGVKKLLKLGEEVVEQEFLDVKTSEGVILRVPKLEEGVEVGPIRLPDVTAKGAMDALGKRASAARERVHTNRLASRRRAADEIVAETAKRQERALARSRGSE